MIKAELAYELRKKYAGMTSKEATEIINEVFDIIKDALVKGDSVQIIGFGTFKVRERKEREGRDPRTGEVISIPPTKRVHFTQGKSLKGAIR